MSRAVRLRLGRHRWPAPTRNAKPNCEKLIMQGLKEVTMHEVGHTLGLRHNFKASTLLTPRTR